MTTKITAQTEKLVCPHCGSQEDVVKRIRYIGGSGDVTVITCRDETACWNRWDKQHGLS